jgi:Cu-Zn family superoxide dismutase
VGGRARAGGPLAVGLATALLAGMAAPAAFAQGASGANATLKDASGQTVGSAVLTQVAGGVRLSVAVRNLPAGTHGIHVHQVGACDPPAFTTAGDHFNPLGHQHGLDNPLGAHAGDLPNLMVAANGSASYATTTGMITLGAGPTSVFDADGSALVIHANADDQVTDPSGSSGGRIACGVLVRGAATLPATGGGPGAQPALGALAGIAAAAGAFVTGALSRLSRRR